MLRFFVLFVLLISFVSIAFALVLSAIAFLALACAVGLPLWLIARPHIQRYGVGTTPQSALERLKTLYIEGKIDLFEFERRAARLISTE